MDQIEFIERLKSGDESAFRELVESQKNRIYQLCFSMIHRLDVAEDLTQDTFIECHRSIGKFKGTAKLSTWLYRLAVNKCLDHIKAGKRQKRAAVQQYNVEDVQVRDHAKNPFESLEDAERARDLHQALSKLPERQQASFTLFHMDSKSYSEIAEILETTVPSVESLLARAKKNLQKLLEARYGKR